MMKHRLLALLSLACLAALLLGAVCGPSDDDADSTGATSGLQEATPEPDPDPDDPAEGTPGKGQTDKVAAFATQFGVSADQVMAHRDAGVGWGALFKLYKLASATGTSVDDLIAQATVDAAGERQFDFGAMEQALTPDQRAVYDAGPKNLGQLVSGNKNKHTTPTP